MHLVRIEVMFSLRTAIKRHVISSLSVRRYATPASKPTGPAKTPGDTRKIFKIYRFGGVKAKEQPKMQAFELDTSTCGTMVLDALQKIKEMDGSLTFRRSCREGICGSCGICLQGANRLACITEIPAAKTITIHPLPHMYVIRDLVVDMTHFLRAYDSVRPYIVRKEEVSLGAHQYAQSMKDSAKFVGLYECILCGCCSTSCPSYWWNGRRFLGPCALLHAYRWIIDTRDDDATRRLDDLKDDFKAFRCHTILNCTQSCPKGLHPALAISKLKRLLAGLEKKQEGEINPLKFAGSGGSGGQLEACIRSQSGKKC